MSAILLQPPTPLRARISKESPAMVLHPLLSKFSSFFLMSGFAAFKSKFKGDIVTPDDPQYEQAIQRWAKNAVRRAKIVAFVKDAQDASLAVQYAQHARLHLAIRGGGHNPAGSSSSEGGLVIDLSRYINECRVDPEMKLAYVGGGAIWKTVDETAIKYGLATTGGTVNHTGVGGLTLGGGFGWLAPAHGLTIDNLVQATVVTADGSIITASETENNDLFWAIRGGGSNFGVVTEFVFRLHEQRPTVYSGTLIFPPPLVDKVFQLTVDWWNSTPSPNTCMIQALVRGPAPDHMPCVAITVFYNGSVEEGRQIFKPFLDLGPIDMTGEIPYEKLNGQTNDGVPHGRNYYMRGSLQKSYSPTVAKKMFERMCEVSSKDLKVGVLLELFPMENIMKVSNNATAFNLRNEDNNVLCIASWDDDSPEFTERARKSARALTDIPAIEEGKPENADTIRTYGNYVGDENLTSDRAQGVFGDNYPRLQQIKKKYDPNRVFNNWFQIVPA